MRNRGKVTHRTMMERVEQLVEGLNIGTFVAVVLVIAWGVTLWGIWMEFTR